MNIPALRFKEFSGDWTRVRLETVYPKIRNGFVGIATPFYVENGIKYLQGKNIKNGEIDATGLIYISEEFHDKYKKSQLFLNDIVMVQSGHVGECAVINEEYTNANCHALVVLTPKNTKLTSSRFFVYYFYSSYGKKLIYKIKTGNTIEHVLASEVKDLSPNTPCFAEQTKIANFLTAVDEKISLLTQKAELLSQYKKGVMQQIFSQELRFKDDDGQKFPEWEEKTLGELCDVKGGKRIPKGYSLQNESNGLPYITVTDMYKGGVDSKDIRYVPSEVAELIKNYKITTNDIFISVAGTLGIVGIVPQELNNANLTENANKLTNLKCHQHYLLQYLMSDKLVNLIDNVQTVGAQPKLAIYALNSFEVSIPSLPEQTKIANFLSAIDEKITNNQTQLDAVKQYKQGLLQQMFV